MTDRPIIFSAPMIRALLAGTKTQTRRLISSRMPWADLSILGDPDTKAPDLAPYVKWKAGERLWVRETWCPVADAEFGEPNWIDYRATPRYEPSHPAGWDNDPKSPDALKWRSPIHMPRRTSRITLTVTDVRVQRLQDISEDDARAEGATPQEDAVTKFGYPQTFRAAFADLLEGIHGPGTWDANPWVAALSFTVARANIDALELARGAQT